jgi:hypothetical protein
MKRALLLVSLLLSSCGTLYYDERTQAGFCFLCAWLDHGLKTSKEKGPEVPGLNSKSTQDFRDPEKDQAPKADAHKNLPVKPER